MEDLLHIYLLLFHLLLKKIIISTDQVFLALVT